MNKAVKVTVSGSFHRQAAAIAEAIGQFTEAGIEVLSPKNVKFVAEIGDFLFVASDLTRDIRITQDGHFSAIRRSDFLFVTCVNGYVGSSTAMEIGFAYAIGKPIVSLVDPYPMNPFEAWPHWFTVMPSYKAVIDRFVNRTTPFLSPRAT